MAIRYPRWRQDRSASTGREVSGAVWDPFVRYAALYGHGTKAGSDFDGTTVTVATTAITITDGLKGYTSSGGTVVGTTEPTGAFKFTDDNDDNDETYIVAGDNAHAPFAFDPTDLSQMVGFETRVRITSAALTETGFLAGFCVPGCMAANTLADDTGVIADNKNFIGFHAAQTASGDLVVKGVHKDGTEGVVTSQASLHTFVKDAWVKLGFLLDPREKKIVWVVNGKIVGENILADLDDVPDDEAWTPIIGIKNLEAVAKSFECSFLHAELFSHVM